MGGIKGTKWSKPSKLTKDMTGQRFTRLLVLSRAPSDKNGNAKWNCLCDCGNTTVSSGFTLRNGEAKSCGCLTTDQLRERAPTHRMSKSPEYLSWAGMHQRCKNPHSKRWARYGKRGIKVCERWSSFENFYSDMGSRPSLNYSLERINNDGDYEPENCKWATKSEQNRNHSANHMVTYRGQRVPLVTAIEMAGTGIERGTVQSRLGRGWTIEAALETPINPNIWTLRNKKPRRSGVG